MTAFINENFLLTNKTARKLYHEYAEDLPVIDFHCHLSPAMIAQDIKFSNLTQAWLEGDHYKWRAMRINGVDEEFCTGKAPDKEKFIKWAETVPYTAGNPLYHWTHLELARYFDITGLLSKRTADDIYEQASEMLCTDDFSVKELLRKAKAEVVCTTDDPADSLEHHSKLHSTFEIKILPTFRPDNIIKTEDRGEFGRYLIKLGTSAGIEISDFKTLIDALDKRHEFFHKMGGRLSDHGMERFFFSEVTFSEADTILKKLIKGEEISVEQDEKYKTAIMLELCRMNHERGWTQQFHSGALRDNNTRLFKKLGPNTGFDSIGVALDARKISKFLSALDETNQLAKTILYNLNPADNEMLITMAGNFNDGTSPAKVQYGAAWWFLDQKNGIEKHLKDISSFSLPGRFVGMVTDSRSFLSYPRHEYFRRIACNYFGEEVEKGSIPDDEDILRPLIEGISYRNAKEYFGF
ncbi:MAG TPA: glucuronate isomerase [Bacteroidales bacterium]|nr:glucuronate isomerase [Bacteroidales bacterium]